MAAGSGGCLILLTLRQFVGLPPDIHVSEHTAAVSSSSARIAALFERQPDTLDHKVMDPASLIESNLPQRLIRSLWQVNARMDDVRPRPTSYGLRWRVSLAR
jgi:hypothetical protein